MALCTEKARTLTGNLEAPYLLGKLCRSHFDGPRATVDSCLLRNESNPGLKSVAVEVHLLETGAWKKLGITRRAFDGIEVMNVHD